MYIAGGFTIIVIGSAIWSRTRFAISQHPWTTLVPVVFGAIILFFGVMAQLDEEDES
jgi:hypothetical protein